MPKTDTARVERLHQDMASIPSKTSAGAPAEYAINTANSFAILSQETIDSPSDTPVDTADNNQPEGSASPRQSGNACPVEKQAGRRRPHKPIVRGPGSHRRSASCSLDGKHGKNGQTCLTNIPKPTREPKSPVDVNEEQARKKEKLSTS